MKINFYLEDIKKKGKILSRLRVTVAHDGKRFAYFPSGIKVPLDLWDKRRQEVKSSPTFPSVRFNKKLTLLRSTLNDAYTMERFNGVPSKRFFTDILDDFFGKTKDDASTLFGFIDQFIIEKQNLKSKGEIYGRLKKWLKKYAEFEKIDLDFSDINMLFFSNFVKFCFDSELSTNYVNKMSSTLRIVIGEAVDRELTTNKFYKKFKIKASEVEYTYLNMEDLEKIHRCKLDEHLVNTRDLFLIGCFTGLRYSDFSRIKKEMLQTIKGVDMILIKTKKGDSVSIPVHPFIKDIFNGEIPEAISNQKTNDAIKVICEKAGVNERITLNKNKGGQDYQATGKKSEFISTHTARRSFVTNASLEGLRDDLIMQITGHKSYKQFKKYKRSTKIENAIAASNSDFFKGIKQT